MLGKKKIVTTKETLKKTTFFNMFNIKGKKIVFSPFFVIMTC